MNTTASSNPDSSSTHDQQPSLDARALRRRLRGVGTLWSDARDGALAQSGLTRDEWRVLDRIARRTDGGQTPAASDTAGRPPRRHPHHPGHRHHPGHPHYPMAHPRRRFAVARLAELGWISRADDGFALTEAGRTVHEEVSARVSELGDRVTGAVSDSDLSTTLASLDAIAEALGWGPETPLPRNRRRPGFGRRGGFGPRGGLSGFGPKGFGPQRFGPRGFKHHPEEACQH